MDKETLSHYGWIVICVLVLAVMLALASPFGSFIAGAIKSTTAGLFNVNQAALGSAGIDVNDMVFENCDHLETEIRNATDTYTGDTCCKACGAVLQAGQTVRPKVPDGGTYYVGVTDSALGRYGGATATYTAGQEFPETVNAGDVYVYGDYEYRYNQTYLPSYGKWFGSGESDWGVRARNASKSLYEPILESINEKPVANLSYTFSGCSNLTSMPTIHSNIRNMQYAFNGCGFLTVLTDIPNSVTNMEHTFSGCTSLTDLSTYVIPASVSNLRYTFSGCKNVTKLPVITSGSAKDLTGTFADCISLTDISNYIIPSSVTGLSYTFARCTSLIKTPTIPSTVTSACSTFEGCSALTHEGIAPLPNSITILGSTFKDCTSLTKAPAIPTNVESITGMFKNCTNLTDISEVVIPNSAYDISDTFNGCTSLVDLDGLVIPNSITHMSRAFAGCTSLVSAPTVPTSVKFMSNVFENCTSLTGTVTIQSYSSSYSGMFSGVDFEAQNLTLAGLQIESYLDAIGATGTNYCAECNGKCNGGH